MSKQVNQYIDVPVDPNPFAPPQAKSNLSQYKDGIRKVPPLPAFCDQLCETIPRSIFGRDRMLFIASQIEKLSKAQITELQAIIEYFMRYMIREGSQ